MNNTPPRPVATALLDAQQLFARVGLAAGMRVADLGCGTTGHLIIPAARIVGAEGIAYAVDIQRSALAATASRAKLEGVANITSVWSNLERPGATAIPEESLDLALLVSTLHVATDRHAVLAEATRLLAPQGTLLVVEWKPDALPFGARGARRIAPDDVRAAVQQLPLIESAAFDASAYYYGIVFKKS